MKLIVGLGNPGKQYERTRHNAGFLAVDKLATRHATGKWKLAQKLQSEIAEGTIGDEKVVFAKPQTFMNRSGDAVRALARWYKIKPESVLIIHDDIDLPLGTIRLKINGSAGGHKGMQSIIDAVGVGCARVRIGIAPQRRRGQADRFVLAKFGAPEMKKLQPVLDRVCDAVQTTVTAGLPKAMSLYNQ